VTVDLRHERGKLSSHRKHFGNVPGVGQIGKHEELRRQDKTACHVGRQSAVAPCLLVCRAGRSCAGFSVQAQSPAVSPAQWGFWGRISPSALPFGQKFEIATLNQGNPFITPVSGGLAPSMIAPFVQRHGQGAGIDEDSSNPPFIGTGPIQVIGMQATDQIQGANWRDGRRHTGG